MFLNILVSKDKQFSKAQCDGSKGKPYTNTNNI